MSRRSQNTLLGGSPDAGIILMYLALIAFGWVNIFGAVYNVEQEFFSFSLNYTKQLLWIGTAFFLILIIMSIDYRTYDTFAYIFYAFFIVLLLGVMFFGREINGARSWIEIGPVRLQPSEFAKSVTALSIAKFLSSPAARVEKLDTKLFFGVILGLPALLIVLQGDAGSALVFSAFALVAYREKIIHHWILFGGITLASLFILGIALDDRDLFYYIYVPILSVALLMIVLSKQKSLFNISLILALGVCLIAYVASTKYIFENFLESHQKERIMVLLDEDIDPQGRGPRYNLFHSKVAIGSGGLQGKGFLQGTQTKFNYVPEQSTDFIFCTVGEEFGFIGSAATIILFLAFFYRLMLIAERQKDKFVRIYAYSVVGIFFFHFAINIAMTIGLFPVVGIPLPFFSYGGSSLWSFTILLFILVKLDAHREQQMERQ